MKKAIKIIFFWVFFPLSFPALLLAWFMYWLGSEYITFDDLVDAFKHYYLGVDE